MVMSVNTNAAALLALQSLTGTSRQLDETQSRIDTGLKVSHAADGPAAFSSAQDMRIDMTGLQSVMQSIDRASGVVSTALSAGQSIFDLLNTMKEKVTAACDPSIDDQSRAAIDNEFQSLRDQITSIIDSATFGGANMLKSGGDPARAMVSSDGATMIEVPAEDLSLGGTNITFDGTATLGTTADDAKNLLQQVNQSITNVNSALARIGTGASSLDAHKTFASTLSDTIETGIGNLVDADLAKESARLQSLQVKQQLSVQALSIANSIPQSILSLFQS